MDKKIGIGHVVYTSIIALLIITFTLVFAFGGNKDAGNQVNVMATGISIILAVIAILMTLVDVAGQRQSIIDIKETAEKLAEYQEKAQVSMKKLLEEFDNLQEIKRMMKITTDEYKKFTEELISEKFKGEPAIKEVKSKLDEEYTKLNSQFNNSYFNKSKLEMKIINEFRRWVKERFSESNTMDYTNFLAALFKEFKNYELKSIISYLFEIGATYEIDGRDFINLEFIKNNTPKNF
ncbi:hypothetical protein [Bacillus safensis]|uniref:hypothetical protein n=1 Tax=Bacillus safensis TaxID=561879 RepID=UPI0020BE4105|nr:hypothetical protein [Bacillus safensis]